MLKSNVQDRSIVIVMEDTLIEMHQDPNVIVVTSDLIRRRAIAVSYVDRYLPGAKGRWFNSYWLRLLDRIILEDKVQDMDPEQKLYYDKE